MAQRDTSRDGFRNKVETFVLTHFKPIWLWLNRSKRLGDFVNGKIIDMAVRKTKSRPFQYSTAADYTSWRSLTDRAWSGRHLPAKSQDGLPDVEVVTQLFQRKPGGAGKLSTKSTLLFASFAQWFTDGFLMTDSVDRRKTYSNHQIDANPLYGLNRDVTLQLRCCLQAKGRKGRLKSEFIGAEEYAPRLFEADGVTKKPEFSLLPLPLRFDGSWEAARRDTIFAFGGDRANATLITAALNTLFLREHNRIAGILEEAHPDWDDERVFETTRNIVIVLLIKLVVEEYINHISPYWFRLRANPQAAWNAGWNKPNWIASEFNLLYRWHGLIPDEFLFNGKEIPIATTFLDNRLLLQAGLGRTLDQASRQPAGRPGLFNSTPSLLDVEYRSIDQGRKNFLASYNDYREAMRFPRLTRFEQISGDPDVVEGLRRVYGNDIEKVEYFVGLFAEDGEERSVVPPLIGRMVAIDAFSQALTNPLLAERVFNEQTFSAEGMAIIGATKSFRDIADRNIPGGAGGLAMSMEQQKSQT
jgi:prostaglandin-endoperoxide synthase 2